MVCSIIVLLTIESVVLLAESIETREIAVEANQEVQHFKEKFAVSNYQSTKIVQIASATA